MGVILIGYRGSGKTTIGRKLADQLWVKFVDSDDVVVSAAGKSIRDIFQQDGEQRFRDLETQAVRQVCAMKDHVIALGGGAVVRQENRQVIEQSGLKRIYLRCDPQVLWRRIQADPNTQANRPHLTDMAGGIEEIRALLAEREPLYRQLMTAELDVTNLTPDEAVVRITRLL